MIEFTAEGIPRPKGSMKHIGRGRMVEQTNVKAWMAVVRTAAATAMTRRLDGPLAVRARFTFQRPKSAKNRLYPSVRSTGDIDKLTRAILDAMQPKDGWPGVYDDDAQVVRLDVEEEYGLTPGVYVLVWELGATDAPTPRQETLPGLVTP